MITFYNPPPIQYLFHQPECESACRRDLIQRVKFIFTGSVLSAFAALYQGLYALKTLGCYLFSIIVCSPLDNPKISDVVLESYKTVAYLVSIVALPLLGILVCPHNVVRLYEKLKLFQAPPQEEIVEDFSETSPNTSLTESPPRAKEHIPLDDSQVKEDEIIAEEIQKEPSITVDNSAKQTGEVPQVKKEENPVQAHTTYEFYKKNYDKLNSKSKPIYVQTRLAGLPFEKIRDRANALLAYLHTHEEFIKDVGYYRIPGEESVKQDIELRLVSSDITDDHLLDNVGDSCNDRNVICGVLKGLVKRLQLFPYESTAYKKLLQENIEPQHILDAMDDPLKKEFFIKLLRHLHEITTDRDNKMDAYNLAMVFAPNIDSETIPTNMLKTNPKIIAALKKMIENAESY